MDSSTLFVIALLTLLVATIIVRAVYASWLRHRNKDSERKTYDFYQEVANQVNKNKKEK